MIRIRSRTVRTLAFAAGFSFTALAGWVGAQDAPAGAVPRESGPSTRPVTLPSTQPGAPVPQARDAAKARPQIEVCFVLDTTGSMSGLIEGAKTKIWSIANTIIAVGDKPEIKIGLVAYRDKGDAYVTSVTDLTEDIDAVFKTLTGFKADGGGDGPESVNQALNEAVTKVSWSEKKGVTRIIFLVGDAPPHMDYADDVKYPDTCALARKKDITINAVQCGNAGDTTPIWAEIAKLGKGAYIPLAQEGGMVAVATPFDKDLADLSAKAAGTVVAWGEVAQQRAVESKLAYATTAPATVAADRASFFSKKAEARAEIAAASPAPTTPPAGTAGGGPAAEPAAALFGASGGGTYAGKAADEVLGGRGDLVFDATNGHVDLDKLKKDELPPEMRKMSPDERKAYVVKKLKEREDLQQKIAEVTKKRDAYVADERAKSAAAKPADAFDAKVSEVVKEQAEAKKR